MDCYVVHSDKNYLPVMEKLFETLIMFSNKMVYYYTINFTYKSKFKNVIPIRYNFNIKQFERNTDSDRKILGNTETVRANMLFIKSKICNEVLKNGDHTYCFVDGDCLATKRSDDVFNFKTRLTDYPLLGENIHEFMIYNGKGNPWIDDKVFDITRCLEAPLFKLLGLPFEIRKNYKQSNIILFNNNCKDILKEWEELCYDKRIINNWKDYAAFNDETILNVILWKYGKNDNLKQISINLPWINVYDKMTSKEDFMKFIYCYTHPKDKGYFWDDFCKIPAKQDIDNIKFLHGRVTDEQYELVKTYILKGNEMIGNKVNLFKHDKTENHKVTLEVFKGGEIRLELYGISEKDGDVQICDNIIHLGGPSGIFFAYVLALFFKKIKIKISIANEYDEQIFDVQTLYPISSYLKHLTSDDLDKIRDVPWYIYQEIFIDEMYYKPKLFENVKNCIDIGSNIGFFALLAFHNNVENLICIEPDNRLNEFNMILNKNNLDKMKIINKALFSTSGDEIDFYISTTADSGAQTIFKEKIYNEIEGNTVTTTTISFEDICNEYNDEIIDLVKIDCEGAEVFLFEDENIEIIKNRVKKVVMELHLEFSENIDDYIKKFKTDDFYVYYKSGGSTKVKLYVIYLLNKKFINLNKVMYLLPHVSTGGMPKYVLEKIKDDVQKGLNVAVIENSYSGDAYVVQRNEMIRILGKNFIAVYEDNKKLLEEINQFKPDILHLQEEPTLFWALSENIQKEIYSCFRNYFIHETSHTSTYDPKDKQFIPDKFVFCNKHHFKTYRAIDINKELYEYAPPKKKQDKDFYLKKLKLDPKKIHVVQVGLFTENKNQGYTFKIAEMLEDKNFQFHFIGNMADNFKDYWSKILPKKPLNCILWGERDDVDSFLNIADVHILPSKAELNPISLKEALSYDIPCLCSDIETIRTNFGDDPNIHWLFGNIDKDSNMLLSMFDKSIKFKFGINTTFYNVSDVMDETIESVINQTYTNWVWFVTDDDSTDNTKEKLMYYCKKYSKMIYVKQNFKKEMFWQPQRFISPECDYIITVDADDVVNLRALEVYNRLLNEYKDDNIVSMSCDNVSYNETFNGGILNPSCMSFQGNYGAFLEGRTYTHEELWGLKSLHIWGHLRCYKNIDGLDFFVNEYNGGCNNDCLHFSILPEHGNHLNIKRNLYNYRKRLSGISHRALSDEEWKQHKNINQICIERKDIPKGTVLDYYEKIYEEANTFLLSELNTDPYTKIGLFTINEDRDFTELKKLYFDYDLRINEFNDDFDYILIYADKDIDFLKKVIGFYKDKEYKEIVVYYFEGLASKFPNVETSVSMMHNIYSNLISQYFSGYSFNCYYRHIIFNILSAKKEPQISEYKKEDISINHLFHRGIRCEISGYSSDTFNVKFIDNDTKFLVYEDNIKVDGTSWVAHGRQYYTNWNVQVTRHSNNQIISDYNFDLRNKNVIIELDSEQLGDTVAWMPYADIFQKKHNCKVYLSTHHNRMFDKDSYPNLTFINPGTSLDYIHAIYSVGVTDNNYDRNKNNWRLIPLQQAASDILGLEYHEVKPKLVVSGDRPIKEKYITIAEHSTLQAKYYNYSQGWQQIVNTL